MNTIVFNALNSNSGGGKSIRDSFLKLLNEQELQDRYVVFAAKGVQLDFITNPKIEIMELSALYSRMAMAPLVYRFVLGRLIDRIGADVVLNIGDLVIHTDAQQIYLFDWPYALDVHEKVWAGMRSLDRLIRKVKLFLLNRDFHHPDIVIAQTGFIKGMLEEKYSLPDVRVINSAVTIDTGPDDADFNFSLPPGVELLYPAVYYPHKNLEILLDVAELIKTRKLDYHIVITVNPDTSAAQAFLDAISARGLEAIITNVGQVPLNRMKCLYAQCDALLMPTLLESFSIVYLEAMAYGLPVFTSDMWFAHAVCDGAAKYFDPFNANDILRSLEEVLSDSAATKALVEAGQQQLASFPSWEENFATYQRFIAELLEKDRRAG